MALDIHVEIDKTIVNSLVDYCKKLETPCFTVVSDTKTYAVLGEKVHHALVEAGLGVTNVVLQGEEVVADEAYIMRLLVRSALGDQTFIAVGSGTVTDITRFVASRTRNTYISVPTAPSVDGFISNGAPLVVSGMKETFPTEPPIAVFGDLQTLTQAPTELIAAGFGDILGKLTSLADWKLAHVIWQEAFDEAVERRVRAALNNCLNSVDEIASRSENGIKLLLEALLESGIGMLEFGNSRPASGSEHHCSHYWEMQLLKHHKPAILHGAKVGYSTSLVAQRYQKIRDLSRNDASDLLEGAQLESRDKMTEEINQIYPDTAEDILRMQQQYLDLTAEDYDGVKWRILERWDEVQAIAETVPSPEYVVEVLAKVNGPTTWQALGLEEKLVNEALNYGHYIRGRFTIMKLYKMMNMDIVW